MRITAQLNDVTTGSHLWAEKYDRKLADVFAVQDEITEAIVAAIEPQLYAAENFRAQRKPPDSLDAWDLVMRALSHYWRVTRQDNVVAQALLEKAIAIDPTYGQALGVLATSYTFSAHMGWSDMAGMADNRRARRSRRDPGRQRGSVGSPGARQRVSVPAVLRRICWQNSILALDLNPNLAGPRRPRPDIVVLWPLAGRLCGGAARAATVLREIHALRFFRRHLRLFPFCRPQI